MISPARIGLISALCALTLVGCDPGGEAPGAPTAGEARALADAESMLGERVPPVVPVPDAATSESGTPEPATD